MAAKLSSAGSPKMSEKNKSAYLTSISSASSSSSQAKAKAPDWFPSFDADSAAAAAYENFLRLPDLAKLWRSKDFPQWPNESLLKPSLQALEITFRFVSVALSDPRPYANRREWKRRLESLAGRQIELIATFCEEDVLGGGGAPIAELSSSKGLLTRASRSSSQEVWKIPGSTTSVVSKTSEASLLPRLATWDKSEGIANMILLQIESQMHRCPYTLGLGEPNLAGKPTLEYDLVVRPSELHSLKRSPYSDSKNPENQTLFTIHQISESWLVVARELLDRIGERIDGNEWAMAASDCWMLERIWKLLSEVEDLHLMMDPDDFLRLKSQLAISGSSALCFRSAALVEVTRLSKDLKKKVPWILGVEVDPSGGPRVQEAAMRLFHFHSSQRQGGDDDAGESCSRRIDLLQGLQAVEAAVKRFFFAYKQLVAAVMGSTEAAAGYGGENSARCLFLPSEELDPVSQMFSEPAYFPSLDAAKTFLANYWQHHGGGSRSSRQV